MKLLILSALSFACALNLEAQSYRYIFDNYRIPPPDRYADVEGNPMYFDHWVRGDILKSDGGKIEGVRLNYNGYTNELEVDLDTVMIALDPRWHIRADVSLNDNPGLKDIQTSVAFQYGLHPDFGEGYGVILFLGDRYLLMKRFDVDQLKDTKNEYGRVEPKEIFIRTSTYFLREGNSFIKLKTKKKPLLDALHNDPRVEEFYVRNHLDGDREADLIRLVSFANTLSAD